MLMRSTAALITILLCSDAASAKMMSDRERARAQAEHLCYNDVQKLCNDAIPDEKKIEACMGVHRAQLSPGCRKVFETGLR